MKLVALLAVWPGSEQQRQEDASTTTVWQVVNPTFSVWVFGHLRQPDSWEGGLVPFWQELT